MSLALGDPFPLELPTDVLQSRSCAASLSSLLSRPCDDYAYKHGRGVLGSRVVFGVRGLGVRGAGGGPGSGDSGARVGGAAGTGAGGVGGVARIEVGVEDDGAAVRVLDHETGWAAQA